jgi:hypothetical protein
VEGGAGSKSLSKKALWRDCASDNSDEKRCQTKSSRLLQRIMEHIMEYNILDFSTWQDDRSFEETFCKLIEGLDLFYKR